MKEIILESICYTDLVYGRINKKLNLNFSKEEIEKFIYQMILDEHSMISKRGKNYYIQNQKKHTQITVNSNNYRVITADKI